jgi:hypothetical protein
MKLLPESPETGYYISFIKSVDSGGFLRKPFNQAFRAAVIFPEL